MSDTPAATFLNFLSGLGAQALMQFGELPNPINGERSLNLAYARYTVELLTVLEAKTAGNRTTEEDEYLRRLLADLRARMTKAEAAIAD